LALDTAFIELGQREMSDKLSSIEGTDIRIDREIRDLQFNLAFLADNISLTKESVREFP
jgi:hypothetical protein